MERSGEVLIGAGLLLLVAAPLVAGIVIGAIELLVVGLLLALLVGPAAYKLLRYPSLRPVSPGEVGRRVRRRHLFPVGGGMLVSFSGIDGSGKTTQADLLVESLEEVGIPTVRIWARWRPILTYPLMGVLYVTLGWRRKDYDQSRVLQRIWAYLVLVDQVAFATWRIWPHLLRGRVVCVDRYVIDHLVELRFDGLFNERSAKLYHRLLPVPGVSFVLDSPVEVAMERKGDTGEMLDRLDIAMPVGEYLGERRNLLLEVGERFDARVVDTTGSIDEVHEEVHRRALDAYFGS